MQFLPESVEYLEHVVSRKGLRKMSRQLQVSPPLQIFSNCNCSGKTFTLVALFVLCFTKLNYLFLTLVTFASSSFLTATEYIKRFITNNKNLDDNDQTKINDELSKNNKVGALQCLVEKYNELESLIVFADFSDLVNENMDMLSFTSIFH